MKINVPISLLRYQLVLPYIDSQSSLNRTSITQMKSISEVAFLSFLSFFDHLTVV